MDDWFAKLPKNVTENNDNVWKESKADQLGTKWTTRYLDKWEIRQIVRQGAWEKKPEKVHALVCARLSKLY